MKLPHLKTTTLSTTMRILSAASEAFGVLPRDILGKQRHRTLAAARHVSVYLMRREGWSYPEIGRELGQRDHTSAMASYQRVLAALANEDDERARWMTERVKIAERTFDLSAVVPIRYRIDVAKALAPIEREERDETRPLLRLMAVGR